MSGTRYPAAKVFFAFLLCPLFAGLAAVPFMLLKILIEVFTRPKLIGEVRGLEVFSLFFSVPILAQIIFLLPALMPGLLSFLFGGVSMGLAAFWFLPEAPPQPLELIPT